MDFTNILMGIFGPQREAGETCIILICIFYYINPNKMHMLQSLFYLTIALHISGGTITHLQEHKQL